MPALIFFILVLICSTASEATGMLTGGEFEYTVVPGDYLIRIGAKFGVSAAVIASENGIDYDSRIYPGKRLKIDNRHIVPEGISDGILINLPQRMLFFFRDGKFQAAFPVGLGKPSWPTPVGDFQVVDRQENKAWIVPKSIQEEMRREGKAVLTRVAPGPENPLGKFWIGLSINGYGIHGTIALASIYQFQSHGCIRMQPDDIVRFYPNVQIGMRGRIEYVPLLLAVTGNGKIFIESEPDIYKRGSSYLETAHQLAGSLSSSVNWRLAEAVIEKHDGVARDVTLVKGTN